MRILTLDDMEHRHMYFRRWFAGFDLVETWTATQAKDALDRGPRFDVACLDHDLAEEHYYQLIAEDGIDDDRKYAECELLTGTGMDVVDHIVKMDPEKRPKFVIVHSLNLSRAEEMTKRLQDAGVHVLRQKFDPSRPIVLL